MTDKCILTIKPGHRGTTDYIKSALATLGDYYDVYEQPFNASRGRVYEHRLVIGDELPKSAAPLSMTPPTKDREPLFADLVLVAEYGCEASDYPENTKGKIVFFQRGVCSFGIKSAMAGKAGAVAAVIYNNEDGPFDGTLGDASEDHVPTWSLSGEEGEKIASKLMDGEVLGCIAYMNAEVLSVQTINVIAQTVDGDPDNCVMLGGHSDSVPTGPGINDDGSGSMSILEIAIQLTRFQVNNCVRFAWWSAEELGLLGSNYYVNTLPEDENRKIRLFMDYDMMGSPNFAYQIYNATNDDSPTGSQELRDLYVDWYEKQGLNYTFIPFDGRSDYDGFIKHDIPAGGIATGAEGVKTADEVDMFGGQAGEWYDACYHQLCDDLGNVNHTAWEVNTKVRVPLGYIQSWIPANIFN